MSQAFSMRWLPSYPMVPLQQPIHAPAAHASIHAGQRGGEKQISNMVSQGYWLSPDTSIQHRYDHIFANIHLCPMTKLHQLWAVFFLCKVLVLQAQLSYVMFAPAHKEAERQSHVACRTLQNQCWCEWCFASHTCCSAWAQRLRRAAEICTGEYWHDHLDHPKSSARVS